MDHAHQVRSERAAGGSANDGSANHADAPGDAGPEVGADTGVACLATLLRLNNMAADAGKIRHQFGRADQPFTIKDIIRAGRAEGLKVRAVKSDWDRLRKTALPAIARHVDGHFFVVAASADDKVLIQDPREERPLTIAKEAFEAAWSGDLVLATRRAKVTDEAGSFNVKWFIPALMRYRRFFVEVLVASFFLQLFALASPLIFQVVIDKVLVHQGLTTLDVLVFALVVVSTFEVLLGGLRHYVFAHTTNRVDVELGARLFRHLLSLPIAYFEARQAGQTVARVRELETIRNFLTSSALTLVIDLLFTVVFLAIMYVYSPVLTYIVLGSLPFYIGLSIFVTPILRRRLEEKFVRGAANQAFLVEAVTGVETLKAMAVEPQMHRKWEEQLAAYVHASFSAANLGNVASQSTAWINKITIALTLFFGAKLVITGDLTVGQLVAFNMFAARVSSPVLRLAQLWQDFQQARISIARLGDVLNAQPEPKPARNSIALPRIEGRIEFDNVRFRYRPDAPEVLRGVQLDIDAGQVIGVVGPSGSGKSTLTKLLQRLHVPAAGRVLVDGVDLAVVDPTWLRRQVGVVLQENVLFNATVRDNIALSDPGISMDRVVEVAKLAGAHDFILELPHGYDTMIGERGSTLSGGQRQRVAIARALVDNPRILVFDEATSALDYESEHIIQQNMRRICAGRTVVIVAHRLAAVRDADRIITIERGEVVEDGTHQELLRAGGRYASLYAHQIGEHYVPV